MTGRTALLLHGLGHDPARASAIFAAALPADVTLVVPPGPLPFGDDGGRAWFGVSFTDAGPVADIGQEAATRTAVIALAEAQQAPVLLMGFGQGGVVALTAYLQRPDLFAGCAIAGGRLLMEALGTLPPLPAHRAKPLFWAHGRADPAIAFAAAEAGRAALVGYGIDLTAVDHDGGHELPDVAAQALRGWLDQLLANAAN